MHAREWITPATAMFILQRLVEGSWEVPELVNNFDWYILPMANPDGEERETFMFRVFFSVEVNFCLVM